MANFRLFTGEIQDFQRLVRQNFVLLEEEINKRNLMTRMFLREFDDLSGNVQIKTIRPHHLGFIPTDYIVTSGDLAMIKMDERNITFNSSSKKVRMLIGEING